jgi:hypothetical protein
MTNTERNVIIARRKYDAIVTRFEQLEKVSRVTFEMAQEYQNLRRDGEAAAKELCNALDMLTVELLSRVR